MKRLKNCNAEQNIYFKSHEQFSVNEMMEEDWDEYLDADTNDENTERHYKIGFWNLGMYGEKIIRACSEEMAEENFLDGYKSKLGYQPYIARCETLAEVKERIASYGDLMPYNGQTWVEGDPRNMYHEALYN